MTFVSDCDKCGDCCRSLKIHMPHGIHLYNKEFLKARGFEVGNKYIKLDPFVCPHLTDDNLCDLHNKSKPLVCIKAICKKKRVKKK